MHGDGFGGPPLQPRGLGRVSPSRAARDHLSGATIAPIIRQIATPRQPAATFTTGAAHPGNIHVTTKHDDELPTIPVLELLELENNRRFGLLTKHAEQTAQALNRIDVSLARLADASEAFVSLFGSALGTAQTESGEVCGYIQIAGPLGVRGGRA